MVALITRLLALSVLILSVAAVPMPQGGPSLVPAKVTITGLSYAGSGCGANTVGGMVEPDLTSITILFSKYIAAVGPDIPITENRKNCALIIGFEYSPGWRYALFSTEYRGFLSLDSKVTALQKSEYWFDNQKTTTFQSTWTGPQDLDYNFTDDLDKEPEVWSPCHKSANNLYINTQIRVENSKNKKGSGLITTDSITQRVTHVYGIRWRKC